MLVRPSPPSIFLEKLTEPCGFCSVMMVLESLVIEFSRDGRTAMGLGAESTLNYRASLSCLLRHEALH